MRSSLLLLFLLSRQFATAQTDHSDGRAPASFPPVLNQFEHVSVENGLSNNSVMCIFQDREGFMWFGTNDGLNKYDGYTFTTLKADPNGTGQGFQNNQIYDLCEDHKNRLWAATLGGLHEVDKQTGRVTPHLIRASNADKWNYQHSVYEDTHHVLWVSTLGGLARYEPDRHRFTLFPVPQPRATIKTVFEDPQHRFWVATYEGLYRFDRVTGRFTLTPVSVAAGEAQPTFISFYLDSQQVLWLGTSTAGRGLFRMDLSRQPWHLEPYKPAEPPISYTFLNAIHADQKGFVWVATTTGLHRIDPTNRVVTLHPDPNALNGISSNMAQAAYHDRAGTLWVGTDNGIDRQGVPTKPFMTHQVRPNRGTANLPENKVIALLPGANGSFWTSNGPNVYRPSAGGGQSVLVPPAVVGSTSAFKNHTQAFLPDSGGAFWMGTWAGLYHVNPAANGFDHYPSEVPIEYMSRAPDGTLWVGGFIEPTSGIAAFNPKTHRYTYYKYNPKSPDNLPDQYIHGLLASRTGEVWVPFRKNGIGVLNPKTGRFRHYVAGGQNGLNSNDMQTIYEDDAGIIWLGTQQGGVNRFDARTGRFSAITTREGLPSNNVVGIINDRAGHLWLSTDKGLCRFDPRTKAVHNYQTTNGLPSNDFTRNTVFRRQNQLFFGTLNGVVYFNPDSIRDDTRPFPVHITELNVRNEVWPLADSVINLKHDENFLSFGFAALTYAQAEQNQYAYQLMGVDRNWVQNGNRHFASYTNLPPGHYTFRVKAANSDGIWNEQGASLHLIIQPPWWATWWAYTLYALLAVGVVWSLFRFYGQRIRQRQELELNRREANQLKAVDELKTRFFSNITHEFRTPLSLIIAPVEQLVQQEPVGSPVHQTLLLVHRNARQLLRLINQLLDLSKVEANRMTVSLMRGDVGQFVTQLVDSFQLGAEQKGVTLNHTIDELGREYAFDADKWEKILTNLLSNALKFTEKGGQVVVTLTARSVTDVEGSSAVTITVTDSGIGISPEHLPHIFDRFYQVDTSHTRAYEGTGIGLSLVHELVELVGGTINVQSQPDAGTTVVLSLPVQLATDGDGGLPMVPTILSETRSTPVHLSNFGPNAVDNQLSADSHRPLVLLVEDNTDLRDFLARSLSDTYRILCAADGEAGWQLTQTELPDIVISDVMMPRMDGYALTNLIKNHPHTDHIAVVILSAKAAHTSRIEGLQKGADEYVAKPFDLQELQLRLHNLIAHRQKLLARYREQFTQPNLPGPLAQVDDDFLRRVYERLENHLSNPDINVDWLADQLAMSRKTLYRKIHTLLQLSPHELIRQYRLRKAADLLRAGQSASQTAYQTGFKTPAYFTLVFKEFYGKTPTEFMAEGFRNAEQPD